MKFALILAAALALSISCGIGDKPIANDDRDSNNENTEAEIEIIIENDIEDSEITEIWIDPSDEPWSENRLDGQLAPGESFTVTFNEETEYDIQLIDDYGESYTLMNQFIDEDGFEWEVVYEDADWNNSRSGEWTTVSIENGLRNEAIWYCYGTLSSADDWGTELLDYMVLEAGESFSIEVEAGDYYDFYARNAGNDFYFSFDNFIDDAGFTWVISEADKDNTLYEDETHGASAAITLINRLGNVSILYAFTDESGGEYWGGDLLEGDVLEPREEFTFYLPADKFYDFQVEDEFGNTYTLWEVSVKDNGIFWEVIQDDLDD